MGTPPRRSARLPGIISLCFTAGVTAFGIWVGILTHSWIPVAAVVFLAVFPARTHAGDLRAWARRRRRGPGTDPA